LSIISSDAPGGAWTLGVASLAPFVASAMGVWFPPHFSSPGLWLWVLCLYTAAVVGLMSLLRVRAVAPTGEAPSARAIALAAAPPLTAAAACLAAPLIGFRWSLALLIAALAVQSAWELNQNRLPSGVRQAQPVVSVGALLALLVAFMGC
jgi:hypothetical protein